MNIIVTSIPVINQEKALTFYTGILRFEKKQDIPMGGEHRWLTVVSPGGNNPVELLLEPMAFPPAQTYQQALYEAGIPATVFGVADAQAEFERLEKLGVHFRTKPTVMGPVTIASFDDTCGNWIQIVQA